MQFKLTLLFFIICSNFLLHAQVDLEITVYEARANAPLPDVRVILKNTSIGYLSEKITDARGKVAFYGLPVAGAYVVEVAETAAFYSAQKTDIILRSNTNATVTLPLFRKEEVVLDEFVVHKYWFFN